MDPSIADSEPRRVLPLLRSVIHGLLVLAILAIGVAVMLMFKSMKREVAKKAPTSTVRRVAVIEVAPRTVPSRIVGHGTVRAKNVVQVVPQVSGRVTWVSPRFKAGHRVAEGEPLFKIESETYQATLDQITAERNQLTEQIGLLDKTVEFDRKRLAIATRSRDLAKQEFERVRDLYERQSVGSRPSVEAAERTYLARENEIVGLNSAIQNHPIRVQELNAAIAAADARLARAQLDLDRTKIVAPFPARVAQATVRPGQVVMAGMTAMGSGAQMAS